jgi:hypothetical protein
MNEIVIDEQNIKNKIYTIRGMQVILDRDLAEFYGVKPIRLREQVKRNIKRFPDDFMFQLKEEEIEIMVSQNAIPSKQHLGGAKPYVFTEQGVSMLSAVLKTELAIEMSIKIVRAFVNMRKIISSNSLMFERFERIEERLNIHDENFKKIFNAIEDKSIKPKQGIFYDGEIFDAYRFINELIKSAKKSIILIDNYIDETTLTLFSKVPDIKVTIYTKNISKQLKLDLKKYNTQYKPIELKPFKESHDRFMIIDETEVYHIGASLKDLGKKWFAFSRMDKENLKILERLI